MVVPLAPVCCNASETQRLLDAQQQLLFCISEAGLIDLGRFLNVVVVVEETPSGTSSDIDAFLRKPSRTRTATRIHTRL